MKTLKHILFFSMLLFFAASCEEGIDPITKVEPGEDEEPPEVNIEYPNEGTKIMVTEEVTSIDIELEVTDDIEIDEVTVELDDEELDTFDEFKDYRRFLKTMTYEELTNGDHTLSVTATDKEGKSTTETVEFEKVPPYDPKFDGEVFYMPFDGDYMELISQEMAEVTGSPEISSDGITGQAYAGAADSYITFPIDDLKGDGFAVSFWYKLNADPVKAGLFSISPEEEDRTSGIRLFREGDEATQNVNLNYGLGDGESWPGGVTLDAGTGEWVHLTVSVSETETVIYVDGEPMVEGDDGMIDWSDCEIMSIGSGSPNFDYWEHFSDESLYDEMRIFNKGLSQEEVQAIMDDES
ncbi:MAG: LamG-like jellyroll fold domain-containing protein [Marinilabilia sp.]